MSLIVTCRQLATLSLLILSLFSATGALAVESSPQSGTNTFLSSMEPWYQDAATLRMRSNIELRQLQALVEKRRWQEADRVFDAMDRVRDRRSH